MSDYTYFGIDLHSKQSWYEVRIGIPGYSGEVFRGHNTYLSFFMQGPSSPIQIIPYLFLPPIL